MSSLLNPPALLSLLIALTVHECAHAWAANKLGDPTAKYDGRLTLNPIAHLDPIGTVVFIVSMLGGIPFGWAKPVPVDPRYLKKPKRDNALIAAAGPASNLVLATLSTLLLGITLRTIGIENSQSIAVLLNPEQISSVVPALAVQLLASSLFINLGLMAFNLLPIPPLDGSKILYAFVPLHWEEQYLTYLRYGWHVLLMVLIIDNVLRIPIITGWFWMIVKPILGVLLQLL